MGIQLRGPCKDGFQVTCEPMEDWTGKTEIEIARVIWDRGFFSKPGEYTLIDNRSGFRYPVTKKGVPSKVRKWVKEEVVLGRFTEKELEANEQ